MPRGGKSVDFSRVISLIAIEDHKDQLSNKDAHIEAVRKLTR